MADAVTSRYIYPPNWEGHRMGEGLEGGIAAHQGGGPRRWILHLTNKSDGTGESLVEKINIDKHPMYGNSGGIAVRSVIEWVEYDVFGMDVELYWERIPSNVKICTLPGGATTQSGKIRGPLTDPGTGDGSDGTGDILLTTVNHANLDFYDIRICFRLKDTTRPGRDPDKMNKVYVKRVKDGEFGAYVT